MLKQKGRQLTITDINVLEEWSKRPLVSENSIIMPLLKLMTYFLTNFFLLHTPIRGVPLPPRPCQPKFYYSTPVL